ncbi:hypothetical protein R6Q59_010220 [Mikania micrantha]
MEFRLLIPKQSNTVHSTAQTNAEAARSLTIDGQTWMLSGPLDFDDDRLPKYACVSYKWGRERQPHALYPQRQMSTHVIPSLTSAMKSRPTYPAFWTDVLCIPPEEGVARQATLENMGAIYARAAEVIVVLGENTFNVLQNMIATKTVSEADLHVLETDMWVASVWTYQELVNAGAVCFMSEMSIERAGDDTNGNEPIANPSAIECDQFLNALGHGLVKYGQSQDIDTFLVSRKFPNLNILENLLVDWMVGSHVRYSALAIFSNVCMKRNEGAANYYYAIFGALSNSTEQLVWSSDEAEVTLAEKMMKICESKSDFSYIYSVADRDVVSGRRWRPRATVLPPDGSPAPDVLQPPLVWHFWGEAQSGSYDESGRLWLHNMIIIHHSASTEMSMVAKKSIMDWLNIPSLSSQVGTDAFARIVHSRIQAIGFRGSVEPVVAAEGLIFAIHPAKQEQVVDFIISNEIRFGSGAPGLVRLLDADGEILYSVCLFIGMTDRLLQKGVSVLL